MWTLTLSTPIAEPYILLRSIRQHSQLGGYVFSPALLPSFMGCRAGAPMRTAVRRPRRPRPRSVVHVPRSSTPARPPPHGDQHISAMGSRPAPRTHRTRPSPAPSQPAPAPTRREPRTRTDPPTPTTPTRRQDKRPWAHRTHTDQAHLPGSAPPTRPPVQYCSAYTSTNHMGHCSPAPHHTRRDQYRASENVGKRMKTHRNTGGGLHASEELSRSGFVLHRHFPSQFAYLYDVGSRAQRGASV